MIPPKCDCANTCVRAVCACAFTGVLSVGCSTTTQYQQHYFAAADIEGDNPVVSYYRVTTKAQATNQETNLITGFYDANAVRHLYGQVTMSEDGITASGSTGRGPTHVSYNPATGVWETVNEQVFTILFGTDASAMADQIKAFAKSETTGKQLESLLVAAVAGDEFIEVQAAENNYSDSIERLSAKLEEAAGSFDAGESEEIDQAKAAVLDSLHAVAVELARINGVATVSIPSGKDDLIEFIEKQKTAYKTTL